MQGWFRGLCVAAWLGRCESIEIGVVDEMNASCGFIEEEMLASECEVPTRCCPLLVMIQVA